MAKRKFRSAAQGRGFKQLGSGLRAAEDRIQEQRKIEIDSLRLAQLQQKEENQNYISGLTDAARFEEGVLKESHKLEDKVRTRKYEALKKLAQTDVARLEGEAKEKQKEVDYWKEWTPKAAKAAQSMVTGIWQFQDVVRGIGEYNAQNDSGLLDGLIDRQVKGENIFTKNFFKDFRAGLVNKDNFENYLVSSALWQKNKTRTSHGATLLYDYLKKNKGSITAEVTAHAKAADPTGQGILRKDEIISLHEFYAHSILRNAGIPATTKRGRKIIELYKSTGKTVYDNRLLGEHYANDQTAIATQAKKVLALQGEGPDSLDDLKEESKNLLAMVYGSHTKVGNTIKIPAENGMTWPSAMFAYGTALMDVGFKDIGGRENFKEIMSHLMSVPTKGNEKSVPMSEKHEHILNSLLKEFDKRSSEEAKRGSTKQNEYNNLQYNKVTNAITNQYWKFKTDENLELVLDDNQQPIPLTGTELLSPKDYKMKLVRKTLADSKLNESGKTKIYHELDLLGERHKVAEQFVIATDLYNSGDSAKARNYINSQTATDRELLRELFDDIDYLDQAITPIQGKRGRKALDWRVKTLVFQAAEGENFSPTNSKFHPSATWAQIAFVDAVEKETIRLGNTKQYKDDPEGAYEAAFTTIKAEYDLGNRKLHKDKASGRWLRSGDTTVKPGQSGRSLIYEAYDGDLSQREANHLTLLNQVGAEKDLFEVRWKKTDPWSGTTFKTVLDNNLYDPYFGDVSSETELSKRILTDVKAFPNDQVTALATAMAQLKEGKFTPWGYPPNLKIYVDHINKNRPSNDKVTIRRVANQLLSYRKNQHGQGDVTVPAESTDQTVLSKYVGNYDPVNSEEGICAFAACTAQGVNPMSFTAAYQLEGLDISDNFLKQHPDGNDPANFLKNGGLYRTPVNYSTLETLNLAFFTDRNQAQFPLNNGKPVSISYANPKDKGTALGAEKKNRFGNTLVYSVVSGSNANKTLGWKLKPKKDPNIRDTSTDRYRLDRGSL